MRIGRKQAGSPGPARPQNRAHRRARQFMFGLGALVLIPCVVYGWSAVESTRGARIRNALDRNLTTASLNARILDEQSNAALSLVKNLIARFPLAEALRTNSRGILRTSVHDMVSSSSDLKYAGVYYPSGSLAAEFPSDTGDSEAYGQPWFRGVSAIKSRYFGEVKDLDKTQVLTVAIPLGPPTKPSGYLLAYYRLARADQWLQGVGGEEQISTYAVNMQSRVVARSAYAQQVTGGFSNSPILRDIKTRPTGETEIARPNIGDPLLAGYAYAKGPNWVLVVTQPKSAALSSTNVLAGRLSLMFVPALFLMLLAARTVAGLYRKQEAIARQLEAQNLQLRKADEAKSDFLANVSHDLWTPLAGIQLSISSLLDSDIEWTHQQAKDHLELAGVGLSQISNRVRNLLEMARLETNADLAPKEPCDLWDLVSSAVERLEPLLRGRKICADFPDHPLMFQGRYAQVEMVLMNLLENSVKYSPAGTPLIMAGSLRGDYVYFSLQDSGPGVAQEDVARIFEKFYRAQPTHHLGGTGLGLAICKNIVESHGGLIGVRNAPSGGAVFWFCIPELGAGEEPKL